MIIPSAFTTGFTIGLSLILAIGAQNAFVLRQGVRNEHVLAIVLTCSLSDALLILLGVSSFSQILSYIPWIDPLMRYGGALFLLWYGTKSILSALQSNECMVVESTATVSLKRVLVTCLVLTWLNPHVYLDTVVLIGTISTRFPGEKTAFAAGATTASFIFFFVLGFGATYLRPLFANPITWRTLEVLIALIMWGIALRLVIGM